MTDDSDFAKEVLAGKYELSNPGRDYMSNEDTPFLNLTITVSPSSPLTDLICRRSERF
jgi:hypothetical protein